ncbi:MAG: TetR/AcrR family transcriptional regulator [Oscillospiraceae bacterium]|nr:TetR/AcrR family transcriptional regulator [Oscillospiraceae bacterium]
MPKQTFFNLPEHKREHVTRCAVSEFARQGYKQASISRIVADAGIAKGSFYQYFEDKDDLFMHIVLTEIGSIKQTAFEEGRDQLAQMNLSQFLRHIAKAQLEAFREQPELFSISLDLLRMAPSEPVYEKLMQTVEGAYNTFFLPIIQHEIDKGRINAKVNARMLNYMLMSINQYQLSLFNSGEASDYGEEAVDALMDDLDFILSSGIYNQ